MEKIKDTTLNEHEKVISKSVSRFFPHNFGDYVFYGILRTFTLASIFLLVAILCYLYIFSKPALDHFGIQFFISNVWSPIKENFGALAFAWGTIATSIIALFIAVPLSIGTAIFLVEFAPKKLSATIALLIELLAAIPSVVYGLWGIFFLVPVMRDHIQPILQKTLGFLPIFQGEMYGIGMLTAGMILSIMIIPTITAISREIFKTVPATMKEAALALGSTRWEMIQISVLSSTKTGIFGAITLGLGRALSETMAVTMLIGNRSKISTSIFDPAQSMASVIANEFAEASNDLHLASLTSVAFGLLLISFIITGITRFLLWKSNRTLGVQ